ncbi:ubiquitin-conjugating enzyme E2 S isoform X2 [Ahaetulla prasina]|uniref:ubiquitin-conjugating enzyme E2 S isoform X2 n=1 Tax=Ahaetulla prasina TaxID=499056 RepID=UPI0026470DEB|nr:ubiquitin-conjugating enzyme E2 S isoform X2 [Ahaetulla prasina]
MNSNVENLPPHVIRLVYKEVSTLTSDPPEGIKVFPNEEDITDVQVTIEGPEGTPYSGGLFRMKLILGKDFPASPPKGYFLTKIFHPNVGANGEICVNVLKKDWKAELGIRHVLLICNHHGSAVHFALRPCNGEHGTGRGFSGAHQIPAGSPPHKHDHRQRRRLLPQLPASF